MPVAAAAGAGAAALAPYVVPALAGGAEMLGNTLFGNKSTTNRHAASGFDRSQLGYFLQALQQAGGAAQQAGGNIQNLTAQNIGQTRAGYGQLYGGILGLGGQQLREIDRRQGANLGARRMANTQRGFRGRAGRNTLDISAQVAASQQAARERLAVGEQTQRGMLGAYGQGLGAEGRIREQGFQRLLALAQQQPELMGSYVRRMLEAQRETSTQQTKEKKSLLGL